MSRSVVLLATLHQFQGPKFRDYVEDKSYRNLIEQIVSTKRIDFMFEEAAGRRPSIAEECANSLLQPGQYMDVDPAQNERRQYGIPDEMLTGGWIDRDKRSKSEDMYGRRTVNVHDEREKYWLKRILATRFERGLVICGISHSLSFAFRLQIAEFKVELWDYIPFKKLCVRSHVE
jgi:hypothetical protein